MGQALSNEHGGLVNNHAIALITDSGTDTPADFVAAHGIVVLPLRIAYADGTSYESGVNITAEEVATRLKEEIPKTSLPSPHQIEQAIRRVKDAGFTSAVIVTISGGLSATNQTCKMIAEQMEDFPITVVDSKSIGVAAGLVVMQAQRMIDEGVPYEELGERLAALAEHTSVFFAVKTLDYLHAGGRISDAIYRLGSVLNIKPVLWCDSSGYYAIAKKARGWERALSAMVKLATERAQTFTRCRLAICCTPAADEFDRLEKELRERIPQVVEVVRSGVSPDLLVHTGPELVGIGVQEA